MTFFVIALVAIDQVVKYFVSINLRLNNEVTIVPNLLYITYIENRGAAFGLFQNQRYFFIIFATIMIMIFFYFIKYKKIKDKIFLTSALLIIAGGIGNIIDRVIYGYVIDYIRLSFFPAVCNFADYCITLGTIGLIFYVLFRSKNARN